MQLHSNAEHEPSKVPSDTNKMNAIAFKRGKQSVDDDDETRGNPRNLFGDDDETRGNPQNLFGNDDERDVCTNNETMKILLGR